MLQRYFVAEGVQHGHAVAVVDADIGADALLAGMPSLDALDAAGAVTPSSVAASAAAASHATAAAAQEDEMKIAWRYRDVPVIKDELGASAAQQTKNAAAAADADDGKSMLQEKAAAAHFVVYSWVYMRSVLSLVRSVQIC